MFWRLLSDPRGNLLEVTELGRFPTRKLRTAVTFRSATCDKPTCTVSAIRCDLDHHIPALAGPTTARNLDPKCRRDHRAKPHAGHHTARAGPQTTWTTPTGNVYTAADEPLPTATWTHHLIDLRWPTPKQRSIEESLADWVSLS